MDLHEVPVLRCKMKQKKKVFNGKIVLLTVLFAMFVLVFAACAATLSMWNPATGKAILCMESDEQVSVTAYGKRGYLFSCEDPKAGLVFYVGARVDHRAYAPLMKKFAQNGVSCVLLSPPLELAFLDPDAPEGIPENLPEVPVWYLGGHSLGGSMAGSYLKKHPGEYDGILLLASYVTSDLSEEVKSGISVYGDRDGVLSFARYQQNRGNLPKETKELVIKGGNHSGFADYGLQKNDKEPEITNEEQMEETVNFFLEQIK